MQEELRINREVSRRYPGQPHSPHVQGRTQNPALMSDRNVTLFFQACIEDARELSEKSAEGAPLAPVDAPRASI